MKYSSLIPGSDLRFLNIFPITTPPSDSALPAMAFTATKSTLKAEGEWAHVEVQPSAQIFGCSKCGEREAMDPVKIKSV